MFEQQILSHKVPKNFFNSINMDHIQEQCVNKHQKIIQDLKRRILNAKLEEYEIKIQNYEHRFEQQLRAFESETSNTNSSFQMPRLDTLMYLIKTYVYHHANILIRQIRYKESCLHVKLLRQYHRRLLSTQKNISVYPQIIVDVPKVPLNRIQLDYLSCNGKSKLLFNSTFNYEVH
jgi:hypothetical protein